LTAEKMVEVVKSLCHKSAVVHNEI
jgi:hypothetical protein